MKWTFRFGGRTESAIGHKRIQPVEVGTYEAIRLTAVESVGRPHIRSLAAFDTAQPPPSAWDAPTAVWAANLVGQWRKHAFQLDLTSHITAAAQYKLRFVPLNGKVEGLTALTLRLHGVDEPALLKRSPARADELILDITGVAETVALSGTVIGAESGSVTLQKL